MQTHAAAHWRTTAQTRWLANNAANQFSRTGMKTSADSLRMRRDDDTEASRCSAVIGSRAGASPKPTLTLGSDSTAQTAERLFKIKCQKHGIFHISSTCKGNETLEILKDVRNPNGAIKKCSFVSGKQRIFLCSCFCTLAASICPLMTVCFAILLHFKSPS